MSGEENMEMHSWETLFESEIKKITIGEDPAHDLAHFKRVVQTAKKIGSEENADSAIIIPAAWLHDFIIIPKSDSRRPIASQLSASAAIKFLNSNQYPEKYFTAIAHAIEAHSFSAGIEAKTIEAKVIQDADRLDGIGAIGIARLFATAAQMNSSFYNTDEPFAKTRTLDDKKYALDHFYVKLFKTVDMMQTESGKNEAKKRAKVMSDYIDSLKKEIL